MELIQYPQQAWGPAVTEQIIALEQTAWPQEAGEAVFPTAPDTYVTSFLLVEEGRVVCHAGIRRSTLRHRGETYLAYGLSEVVTHPRYRSRGLATRAVRRAAAFIRSQGPDLSLFTCAKDKVPLYTRGGWEAAPGACLVGGTEARPFRSDSLGLTTMMLLISDRSRCRRAELAEADLFLPLGEGELW